MAAARKLVRTLPLVVILGATGTGKTKLAIQMARHFKGEVISADSMQVYKGLDIVTNKVTEEEMQQCPHHMINYVDPVQYRHTVIDFRNKALPIIDKLLSLDRIPIIVGGTNYYIEALLWDLLVGKQKTDEERRAATAVPPPGGGIEKQSLVCTHETPEGGREGSPSTVTPPGRDSRTEGVSGECSSKRRYEELSAGEMYAELQRVDQHTAHKTHPNDKRKILRALEVFETEGRPLSAVLAEQHAAEGGGGVSGPLRYDPTVVFNIHCDRQVLDERTDQRVDQMMEAGLIQELSDFHDQYNKDRLTDNREADYTLGIFQSIGFKEFHEYLLLPMEERGSEKGKCLLKLGLDEMKRVTRRYARKQNTWFNNRFLKRRGSTVPKVYMVSSTDPARWQEDAHDVAVSVIQAVIDGREPPVVPVTLMENTNIPAYNTCTVCDMVFFNTHTWTEHMRGRRHRNGMKRKALSDAGVISYRDLKKGRKCEDTAAGAGEGAETLEVADTAIEAVQGTQVVEDVERITGVIGADEMPKDTIESVIRVDDATLTQREVMGTIEGTKEVTGKEETKGSIETLDNQKKSQT